MFIDLPEEERAKFILIESFKLYLMPEEFQDLPQLPAGLSVRCVSLGHIDLGCQAAIQTWPLGLLSASVRCV